MVQDLLKSIWDGHYSQMILIVYSWVAVVARNAMYPQEARSWYEGISDGTKSVRIPFTAGHFVMVMKIISNTFHQRQKGSSESADYARHVFFNWLRCELFNITYALAFDGTDAFVRDSYLLPRQMTKNLIMIAFITWFLNKVVKNPIWFERNRLLWSILMVEYVAIFGACIISLFNKCENLLQGNALISLFMIFLDFHYSLGGDWIEDIFFGDMDQSYGNKGLGLTVIMDNLPWYLCHVFAVPVLFAIQFFFTGSILRFSELSDFFASCAGGLSMQLPVKWQIVDLGLLGAADIQNKDLQEAQQYSQMMFCASMVIYSQVTVYYQRQFIEKCQEDDATAFQASQRRVYIQNELDVSRSSRGNIKTN